MGTSTDIPLVLYVEDEADNFTIADLRLRGRFRVIKASTDREACDIVRQRGSELWAVLMDVQLRGGTLDGFQLTRVFTGRPLTGPLPTWAQNMPRLDAPIFVMTAYGATLPVDVRACGAAGLWSKPVDYRLLISELQRPRFTAPAAQQAEA
jgi:CheY-like chemotaxis protein